MKKLLLILSLSHTTYSRYIIALTVIALIQYKIFGNTETLQSIFPNYNKYRNKYITQFPPIKPLTTRHLW